MSDFEKSSNLFKRLLYRVTFSFNGEEKELYLATLGNVDSGGGAEQQVESMVDGAYNVQAFLDREIYDNYINENQYFNWSDKKSELVTTLSDVRTKFLSNLAKLSEYIGDKRSEAETRYFNDMMDLDKRFCSVVNDLQNCKGV